MKLHGGGVPRSYLIPARGGGYGRWRAEKEGRQLCFPSRPVHGGWSHGGRGHGGGFFSADFHQGLLTFHSRPSVVITIFTEHSGLSSCAQCREELDCLTRHSPECAASA